MNEKKTPGWMYQERPANPNPMRNFALRELGDSPKGKRSLRLMLPAWLGGRAGKDLETMSEDFKERKEQK